MPFHVLSCLVIITITIAIIIAMTWSIGAQYKEVIGRQAGKQGLAPRPLKLAAGCEYREIRGAACLNNNINSLIPTPHSWQLEGAHAE